MQDPSAASSKNMVVAVRIRPLSSKETSAGHKQCCSLLSDKIVVISKEQQAKYLRSQKGSCNEYAFDAAFDERSTQREVYETTTKPFMAKLVEGYNVTVFAYGATGAGKTHTMMGNTRYDESSVNAEAGIIPNALQDVFHLLEVEKQKQEIGVKWSVGVTFIEVYNEQVYDLLQPMGKCLPLREDKIKGVVEIAGVAEKPVSLPNEVLDLLQQGNRYRKTEATMANQVSSRSHAVLQLMVRRTRTTSGGREAVVESKLSLIDLAGSERASATQNRGARLNEGANINKSLLALANCINALSEKTNGKAKSVKFRDSKLTHLLRSSLEGNCSLIMIANINPSDKTFEDSHNTLKYANRAKNIKVDPTVNNQVKESNWMERETRLREENTALRNQVAELQRKMQLLHETSNSTPGNGVVGSRRNTHSAGQQKGNLPALPSSSSMSELIDDGMDLISELDEVPVEPHPPYLDVRIPAPMPSTRSGAFTRRNIFKGQTGSSIIAPEEQPNLSVDLRKEKSPHSCRTMSTRQPTTDTDKSLFTLGAAFAISRDDESHELMDTTAEGRAALLPKYSVRLVEESDPSCSSPARSSNQEHEQKNEVTTIRRSARKKPQRTYELTDKLPKYTVRLDVSSSPAPTAQEAPTSLRRSARKRTRDEISTEEPISSSKVKRGLQFHLFHGHHDVSESGLSDIVFLPEPTEGVSTEEIPVSDFLDDMPLRTNKKRRGSGIPLRSSSTSASTSVLPSSSGKVISENTSPETDISTDDCFQLNSGTDLVPLHSAKGAKPFLYGAAASYFNKVTGKKPENCENIHKGSKVITSSKSLIDKPGKPDTRTRAPLGTYLSNRIRSSHTRGSEIAPL